MTTYNRSADLLEFDDVVNPSDPDDDMKKILLRIRPSWSADRILLKPFSSAGFINTLLLATHNGDKSNAVVVRLYNQAFSGLIDREKEIAVTKVLNERGLSPEIYCVFKNGVCMQYLQGKTYKWDELTAEGLRELTVIRAAARALARFHSKPTSDIALSKYGHLLTYETDMKRRQRNMMDCWPEDLGDKEAEELLKQFPSKEAWSIEYILSMKALIDAEAPLALCHLDAHPANMFYFSEEGLEIDIMDKRRHPDAVRTEFLRTYLEEQRVLGDLDHDVTDKDVQRLSVLVDKATLVVYLGDAGASVVIAKEPIVNAEFSKKELIALAIKEIDWYKEHKDRYLALKVPTYQ